LVQPGSVDEVVHVRSLLASTLPVIRARTADLREEVAAGNRLRAQAETARAALLASQRTLRGQRLELARLEERERARSASLASSAVAEGDRALAFTEEARDLSAEMGTREFQNRVQASLNELPGPVLRPGTPAQPAQARAPRYILPVAGRLLTGTGEISDAGVHARGLTFEVAGAAPVVAPRAGRIVFAGAYRSYGRVVILDHGGGWLTLITNMATLDVPVGQSVAQGAPLGRAPAGRSEMLVELRQGSRPVPITPLLS
jgi:septal ring factor EnvC (AmiA/AmiB activator)